MTLKPFQSKYRVAIFLRFQEANDSAANALLKTLEEAPSYVVLILTADNTEQLLPTIVSRCEVLHLRPLSLQTVESFLKQKVAEGKPGEQDTRLLSHLSGGRPGYALRLLQDPSALAFRGQKLDDFLAMLSASRQQKFSYAEKLAGDKDGMRSALVLWLSFWRDVFLRAGGAAAPMENIDRIKEIESLTKRISLSEARRLVSDLEKALGRLEANVNARLLAEVLLLDWPKV
jgi:DNA polymerase III subunit delta'